MAERERERERERDRERERVNTADLLLETRRLQFHCSDHFASQNVAVPALELGSNHGNKSLLIDINKQYFVKK